MHLALETNAVKTCVRYTLHVIGIVYVNHSSLEAFLSCRLTLLDYKPGVRPIGIGEELRQTIGKAVLYMYVIGDICDAAGSLQLCAGHDNGIEAAIHSLWATVDDPAT